MDGYERGRDMYDEEDVGGYGAGRRGNPNVPTTVDTSQPVFSTGQGRNAPSSSGRPSFLQQQSASTASLLAPLFTEPGALAFLQGRREGGRGGGGAAGVGAAAMAAAGTVTERARASLVSSLASLSAASQSAAARYSSAFGGGSRGAGNAPGGGGRFRH